VKKNFLVKSLTLGDRQPNAMYDGLGSVGPGPTWSWSTADWNEELLVVTLEAGRKCLVNDCSLLAKLGWRMVPVVVDSTSEMLVLWNCRLGRWFGG